MLFHSHEFLLLLAFTLVAFRFLAAGFTMPRDVDFCDFGHTNVSGGEAYTRWLADSRDEILTSARP
jgi:hypothetical protein